MRGINERSSRLFRYVDLEERVPSDHPLRAMRNLVNPAFVAQLALIYKDASLSRQSGCCEPSCCSFSIRSDPSGNGLERLDFDLLFRWFVGLGVDDAVCDAIS